MDATTVWSRACDQLKTVLNEDTYSRWIDILKPLSLEADVLTLSVENDFHQMWIAENYLPLIKQALKLADPETSIQLNFSIKSSDAPEPPPPPPAKPAGRARRCKLYAPQKSNAIGTMNA